MDNIEDLYVEFIKESEFDAPVANIFEPQYFVYKDYLYVYNKTTSPDNSNYYTEKDYGQRVFFKVHIPTGDMTELDFPQLPGVYLGRLLNFNVIGKKVYITGGSSISGTTYTYYQEFVEYDLETDTWTNMSNVKTLNSRDYLSLANGFVMDDNMYLHRGYDSNYTNKYSKYSVENDEIEWTVTTSPETQNQFSRLNADLLNPSIIHCGTVSHSRHYLLNPLISSWSTIENLTVAGGYNMAVPRTSSEYCEHQFMTVDNVAFCFNIPGSDSNLNNINKLIIVDYDNKMIYKNLVEIPQEFMPSGITYRMARKTFEICGGINIQAVMWGNKRIILSRRGGLTDPRMYILSANAVQVPTGRISYTDYNEFVESTKIPNKIEIDGHTPPKTELTFVLRKNDDTNYYSFKTGAWKPVDKDKIIDEGMTISEIELLKSDDFKQLVSIGDKFSISFAMRTSDCYQSAFVKKITVY